MQISLKTIRDRHVGINWMPSPISVRNLGLVINKTMADSVAFSEWYNNNPFAPDYIPVQFSLSKTDILWEEGWGNQYDEVIITANCAWKIHEDTQLNDVVNIFNVDQNVMLSGKGTHAIRAGNGKLELQASVANTGTATIVLEYRDTTQYSKAYINITVEATGLQFSFLIIPSWFHISGAPQTITAFAYGAGPVATNAAPYMLGGDHPTWVTSLTATHDSGPEENPVYKLVFQIEAFNKLCFWEPRQGNVLVRSDNGNFTIQITQDSRIITPTPWPVMSDGIVLDADGNPYNYVTIGDYQVLLQSLRTTHYRNGDPILGVDGYDHETLNTMFQTPMYRSGYDPEMFGLLYGMNTPTLAHPFQRWDMAEYPGKEGFMDISADQYAINQNLGDEYMWHPPRANEWITIIGNAHTAGIRGKCTRVFGEHGLPCWFPPTYNTAPTNEMQLSLLPSGTYLKDSNNLVGFYRYFRMWIVGNYELHEDWSGWTTWEFFYKNNWPRKWDSVRSVGRLAVTENSIDNISPNGFSVIGSDIIATATFKTSFASIRLIRKHTL